MNNNFKPIIVTCGDPAGVGPEVVVSAWEALRNEIPLCILIDPNFLPKDIKIIVSVKMNVLNVYVNRKLKDVIELGH